MLHSFNNITDLTYKSFIQFMMKHNSNPKQMEYKGFTGGSILNHTHKKSEYIDMYIVSRDAEID